MRVRLTQISLTTGTGHYPEGSVVEPQDDIPVALLAARLAAGTAELVLEGGDVRPLLTRALAHYLATARDSATAIGAVLALTDNASPAELDAVAEVFDGAQQIFLSMPGLARLDEIRDEIHAAKAEEIFGAGKSNSSGVEQSVARGAHNAEVAGSSPAPASTDNTAQNGGVDGDPAAAEAAAGKPAPAAKPSTSSKAKAAPKATKAGAGKVAKGKAAQP